MCTFDQWFTHKSVSRSNVSCKYGAYFYFYTWVTTSKQCEITAWTLNVCFHYTTIQLTDAHVKLQVPYSHIYERGEIYNLWNRNGSLWQGIKKTNPMDYGRSKGNPKNACIHLHEGRHYSTTWRRDLEQQRDCSLKCTSRQCVTKCFTSPKASWDSEVNLQANR